VDDLSPQLIQIRDRLLYLLRQDGSFKDITEVFEVIFRKESRSCRIVMVHIKNRFLSSGSGQHPVRDRQPAKEKNRKEKSVQYTVQTSNTPCPHTSCKVH
jgi:hypothetical protein